MRRFALCIVLIGCGKPAGPATNDPSAPATAVDQDPLDRAATLVLNTLMQGDYDGLRSQTVQPLTQDLSRLEFDDLAAIVQWLGLLRQRTATETDMSYGGGQRRFTLQFEKGDALELEVSLDKTGKLVGFNFSGAGYSEAERGVLAEPWREFKVYDFVYLDAEGNRLAKDTPVQGTRVDYELVVGGIEAFVGEHHLTVEKIVFDAQGKEIFREPVEFDIKFAEDATGIPRGVVRGYLEVPGPGTWQMDLKIIDRNAQREFDYRQKFETVP